MKDLVRIMYRHRLELVTNLGPEGEVLRTVDSPRIAGAKIGGAHPRSLFFYNERAPVPVVYGQDWCQADRRQDRQCHCLRRQPLRAMARAPTYPGAGWSVYSDHAPGRWGTEKLANGIARPSPRAFT